MKQNKMIFKQQPQVAMLCGMTGSGKTTFAIKLANELPAICFSIDKWMIELYGHQMDRKEFESRMAIVKQLIWETVERLIALNTNVILDYGFWLAKERIESASKIENAGGIPVLYFFDVPLNILKQRLNIRNSQLPPGTFEITVDMLEMFMTWFEHPTEDEGIKIVEITPNVETKNILNF